MDFWRFFTTSKTQFERCRASESFIEGEDVPSPRLCNAFMFDCCVVLSRQVVCLPL